MGVQLAQGFPPRCKQTYREVFHPAVVPPPPFIKLFLFLQFIIMGMCVCHSCSNKCFWGLRFQGLSFWVSVFTDFWSQSAQISGSRNFWVLGFFFFFGKSFGSLFIIVSGEWAQAFGLQIFIEALRAWVSGSQDFRYWVFQVMVGFLVLRFLWVQA